MLQAFVLTLREGLEAFLIVAASVALLHRTGRTRLVRAVQWGLAGSVGASGLAGWWFSVTDNQALLDGGLALAAAASVGWAVLYARRTIDQAADGRDVLGIATSARPGIGAWAGIFLFTVLMVSREGMETVLLMATLLFQVRAFDVMTGAVAGLVLAALMAWTWGRYGHRVERRLFAQVTQVFLGLFLVLLAARALNKLAEAGVFPASAALYRGSEPFTAEGAYGDYLGFVLVLLPIGWWLVAILLKSWRNRRPPRHSHGPVN